MVISRQQGGWTDITTRYPDALPGSNAQDVFDLQDANDAIGIAEQTIKLLSEWSTVVGV